MKLLVLSLGLAIQTCLSQGRLLQGALPESPNINSNRDLSVGPSGGGVIQLGNGINLDIGIGGAGAGGGSAQNIIPVVRDIQCGSTVLMNPGETIRVSSTNFGVGNYRNNEACTWKFEANQCTLSADCPCVDIPKSWECLGDYLKIRTDSILENQRFCGGNRPGQPIYSDTDFLSIRFRSDGKTTALGFMCSIRCERAGMPIPPLPRDMCPRRAP